ncbi:MAG: hypothetical protein JXB48_22895, partial [Candidatus Latescibacteria bacterium]|nr:hypothetical protein [Candidatus Latescibacterota bacterium]
KGNNGVLYIVIVDGADVFCIAFAYRSYHMCTLSLPLSHNSALYPWVPYQEDILFNSIIHYYQSLGETR